MQLVVELVGLGPQRVGDRLARAELALQREQLGAVAQGRHRRDAAPALDDRVAVDDQHPLAEHDDVVADRRVVGRAGPADGRVEVEVVDPAALDVAVETDAARARCRSAR